MAQSGEVKRQDTFRFLQALWLQRNGGPPLVTADSPWSPTIGLLLGTVLPASCAVAVWEGRRAVALAQLARQSGRDQWEMMHLVIAGLEAHSPAEHSVNHTRLLMLLDEVCRLAGERRIPSIVARVAEESSLVEPFRRAEFSIALQERTYAFSSPFVETAPEVPGLRLQERPDAWPLHELYLRSTPQFVRASEGRTARDWQLRRSSSRLSFQVTRWVVDEQDGLAGWLSETPGRNGELRAQLGVTPGNRRLARDLVATALEHAREKGSTSVWSRVPAYATDVCQALEGLGFVETGRDVVLRRSLAIRARDLALAQEAKRRVARSGLATTQNRVLAVHAHPRTPNLMQEIR